MGRVYYRRMIDFGSPVKIDLERSFYDNAKDQFDEFRKMNDDISRFENLIKTSTDKTEIKAAKKQLKRLQARKDTEEVDYVFHVAKMLKYYGDEINQEQESNSLDSSEIVLGEQQDDRSRVSTYDSYETFDDPSWNTTHESSAMENNSSSSQESIPESEPLSQSSDSILNDESNCVDDIQISSFFAKNDTMMQKNTEIRNVSETPTSRSSKKSSKKRKTETQSVDTPKKKVKLFSYILNKRVINNNHHVDDDDEYHNDFNRHDFFESDSLDGLDSFPRTKMIDSETVQIEKDQSKFIKPIISKEGREVCPDCSGDVILRMNDKPPSLNCPKCGISFDLFDTTLDNLVERENLLQKKQDYQPKSHFRIWLGKITNEKTKHIPREIYDEYYKLLGENKIYDLDKVNWDIIKDYTKLLIKRDPAKFKEYSDHVYQITNTIRNKPAVQLSEEQKRDVLDLYDKINVFWKDNKDSFDIERHNAMYNALTLQVIFIFLEYPASVIRNFNMIKGGTNKDFYNKMIKKMCNYFGVDPFYIEHIEMIKNENMSISEKMKQIEEQSNNMESSAFDFSAIPGLEVLEIVPEPIVEKNTATEIQEPIPLEKKEDEFDLGDFFM